MGRKRGYTARRLKYSSVSATGYLVVQVVQVVQVGPEEVFVVRLAGVLCVLLAHGEGLAVDELEEVGLNHELRDNLLDDVDFTLFQRPLERQ